MAEASTVKLDRDALAQYSTQCLASLAGVTCQEIMERNDRALYLIDTIRADLSSQLELGQHGDFEKALKLVELLQEYMGHSQDMHALKDALSEFSRRYPDCFSVFSDRPCRA